MSEEHRRTVEAGYDRIAERYLATKDPQDPLTLAALEELARYLPPGAAVLDLGCGAGVPVTRWLVERGFAVTGVDLSERQLELARRLAPGATFVKSDMSELSLAPETFGAVVAFYSIIHVPREEHPALLADIYRWLEPGGSLLATPGLNGLRGRGERLGGMGRRDALEPLRRGGQPGAPTRGGLRHPVRRAAYR